MKGLLIYNKNDYKKNASYANWLIATGKKMNLNIKLLFKEDIYSIDYSSIGFIINRTRDINISYIYELNNIPVFNNSTITLLGNNKLSAYNYAKLNNIDFLPIRLNTNKQLIEKTTYGHGGNDVYLKDTMNNSNAIYQEYAEILGDIRFYIINNKITHCVLRNNDKSFKSNFTQGGNVELYNPSTTQLNIVNKLISKLDIDYCGVDFFITKDNKFMFNEIEDVVGSRMLSHLGINNTTELFLENIINKLDISKLNIRREKND